MKNVKPGHVQPVVCLDAGHYGKYNRSPVVPTYYESEMNWKLARFLRAELETYGMDVRMTRAKLEKDLSLSQRGKQAAGADLFISLHSNACDTESVDRPVGIYLIDDNCGPIDEQSQRIARILAKTVEKVMATNDHAQVYSRKCSYDRDGDGKKNDDYYGVLYAAHQAGTAAVILEHSFHTNTRAAKWLLIDANLRKLAKAEAKALAEYFGMEKETEEPAEVPSEKPAEKPVEKPAEEQKKTRYFVQAGDYEDIENAREKVEKLKKAGFDAIVKEGWFFETIFISV